MLRAQYRMAKRRKNTEHDRITKGLDKVAVALN
jgi:hypothetical protein